MVLCLFILILSSVPPVSRDALTHHLAVPKLWLEKGLFTELPAIPFSYYPMNLDLLYMVPLYLGNDIVPKYIHFAFALLTALLIYRHVKRRLDRTYGLLGALFFLSIPIIVKLSTTIYVDLGLIFFSAGALFALIDWAENGFRFRSLLMAALACGLAMGSKYNGLIVFFLLSCLVPILYVRSKINARLIGKKNARQFRALGFSLVFAIGSLLVFSPWMIRNVYLTGNPVYPLYRNAFSSVTAAPKDRVTENESKGPFKNEKKMAANGGWTHFAVRKVVYGESLGKILLIPLRVFFEGVDDNPKHFDGRLNPFLLVLPLLFFWVGRKQHRNLRFEAKVLSFFAVAYLLFVFFKIDMRIRWIGPVIPPLVVLSIYSLAGIKRYGESRSTKWQIAFFKGLTRVFVLAMLVWNAQYVHALYRKIDPVPYISGKIDREDYIKRFRPEYELIRYINNQLPENSIVLCLFIGNRIYYFDRKINLNIGLLKRIVVESNSNEQVLCELEHAGITHILLRYDLTERWMNNNLENDKQELLHIFFKENAKQVDSFKGYGLFELKKCIDEDEGRSFYPFTDAVSK